MMKSILTIACVAMLMAAPSCKAQDKYTNSVRYAVSDSGDMRSLVFQVFLRLQS